MARKALGKEEREREWEHAEQDMLTFSGSVVVSVSGGSASAVAWHRCLERFGESRVIPAFADTRSEDEDLYRFLDDCERVFGQKIHRLNSGRDIWDVFDQTGIMRIAKSGNACKASIELKQKPMDEFCLQVGASAVAVGIQFDEPERMAAFREKKAPLKVLFPLVLSPRMSHCSINACVERLGLKPPRLYDHEFLHNNCGGACILAGLAQWNAVREKFPERFAYAEARERAFTEKTGFTVLRDQRNGEVKPYSLSQLREEAEAGRKFSNDWKSNCSCMSASLFPDDADG